MQPITLWAIVSKSKPRLNHLLFFKDKKEVKLNKDERFIKIKVTIVK